MRPCIPNQEVPKEVSEYWDKARKTPIQPSSDPRDEPCFITVEMKKQWIAEGNTQFLEPPPAVQRLIDRNTKKE